MGQVNRVKVYRLVSKYTAEERIIEIATRKLLLEEIIINPINKFTKEDFTQIFKNQTERKTRIIRKLKKFLQTL